MIAPQVPTSGTVGQALFNHHTHGQVDHPMRIMTAGWGSIAQIDVEILLAVGTVMRRGGHQEVNRATGASIAQVVQGALVRGVARGEMATSWTGGVLMVSAIQSQLGYWEVLDVDNALGGVWHVCTRSKHSGLPWEKMVGTGSIKVITCPVHIESRISATVSKKEGSRRLKSDKIL